MRKKKSSLSSMARNVIREIIYESKEEEEEEKKPGNKENPNLSTADPAMNSNRGNPQEFYPAKPGYFTHLCILCTKHQSHAKAASKAWNISIDQN